MKSPFAIFRKHQKEAMVVLTALSMFAFVVMEQLRAGSPWVMPVLAAAVGMMVFGFLGYRRGEPVTWGLGGTALGVAIAVVAMRLAPGPKPAVTTAMGDISHEELNTLITRRNNANNFLRMAFEKINPPRSQNPMYLNYYEQQLRSIMFDFGMGQGNDPTNDVVMGYLLDKEADDMGLSVSDGTISDYINKVTDNKLKPSEYTDILRTLRLSDQQVYDALRTELRARLAMEMLLPHASPTPEQYWDDYRKLQVTQTLDVAAVPVADFLAEAPKPSDEEIRKYYDNWKGIAAQVPGAPGLLQPRRARIEYLEADFAELEKQAAAKPISDAEVKKYYEDHKQEYRNRPPAGSSSIDSLLQNPNALTDPGLTAPAAPVLPAPVSPQLPSAKQPTAPSLPAPSAPSSTAPGTKPPAAPAVPGGTKSTPAPKKADDNKSKSGAMNERSGNPGMSNSHDGEMLALADVGSDGPFDRPIEVAWQTTSPAKPGAKPEAKNEAKPATPPAATAPSHSPAAPQTREPKPPAMPRTGGTAKKENEPEFRPLDDLLQREIRELILRNRTLEVMKARVQGAYDFMNKLREQVIPAEIGGEPAMNAEQRTKALTDYASKHGLKYGITPLLSPVELSDAVDKYPIAGASEPLENPFQNREPVSVLQEVFGTAPELLFQPAQADDHDAHRFAFWKVQDVPDHVPALDEPGVREQAIRGWQVANFAEKAADTRAKELADLVRKTKKPMPQALAGQTVTNKPKGPAVVVVPTTPFSWYTVSSSAPQGLMPETTPKLSDIVGVKGADDAFMKAIFDEMKVGDVKAVPNYGGSIIYVVYVKTRHPENAEEMAAFRERFMKENFFGSFLGHSTYEYLNAPAQQRLVNEWAERMFTKYQVKRNPDEEAPQSNRSRRRTG